MLALAKTVLVAVIVGYLAIALLVWLMQERLLFIGAPVIAPPRAPAGWELEQVSFKTGDGTSLSGVLVLPPGPRSPLVIYYGGNAEEVTARAQDADTSYGARALLLVNYRGYGASAGRPGETALFSDALELYDWVAVHPRIDNSRIAVHGRSLGTAMAIRVAAMRGVRCVVLTSPFASATDVARDVYGWLPVSLLIRHPFEASASAAAARAPALILFGASDNIIRPTHSERLAGLWAGPVERQAFEGFGHNDLDLNPRYGASIREFLDRRL